MSLGGQGNRWTRGGRRGCHGFRGWRGRRCRTELRDRRQSSHGKCDAHLQRWKVDVGLRNDANRTTTEPANEERVFPIPYEARHDLRTFDRKRLCKAHDAWPNVVQQIVSEHRRDVARDAFAIGRNDKASDNPGYVSQGRKNCARRLRHGAHLSMSSAKVSARQTRSQRVDIDRVTSPGSYQIPISLAIDDTRSIRE